MIIAKEITEDWDCNHTYLLSNCKTKAHGYWANHEKWVQFSVPLTFDKRKRKFKYKKNEY